MASSTKLLTIPIPNLQFKRLERLAERSGLTMQGWVLQTLCGPGAGPKPKRELVMALAATREDARRKGTDKLTMREINAEIAAVSRELHGKKSRRTG